MWWQGRALCNPHLNSRFSAASFSAGSAELSGSGTTETPRARSSVCSSSAAFKQRPM
jgi:hypothetical protein